MNLFEFVKSKVTILDVVSEYVTLKQAGSYWKGYSPFKNERTPSFTVSPHRDIYYCFSSGQGGDVISFIAKMENCSQLEAAQHLVERHSLEIPNEVDWKQSTSMDSKRSHEKVCAIFAQWCNAMLARSNTAQAYLAQREITEKTIDNFSLGFCPQGPTAVKHLLAQAQKENILAKDFIDTRLLMQGKRGLYTPFEERIIFPIRDNLGRTCGFGGRIFKQKDTRAKYYNSHDHDFFNKSSILFGLNNAKQSIQKLGTVYLVEGYTDCIAMAQAGYPNTVAVLGTSCTVEHLKLLARYAQKLFVVYDGDAAGKKAILRLAQLCWQVNIELSVVSLPEKDDPSSFLEKHGTLEPIIDKAQEIFLFFIEQLGTKFLNKNLQEKLATTKQLMEAIGPLEDPIQQDILLHKAATTFDVPFETLKQTLKKQLIQTQNTQKYQNGASEGDKSKPQLKKTERFTPLEKKLFSAILTSEAQINQEDENFLLVHLPRPLAMLLKKFIQHGRNFDIFFSNVGEKEQRFVSKLSLETNSEKKSQTFRKLFIEFQKNRWKMMVNEVKIKLAQARATTDNREIKKILADFQELKKTMLRRGIT